ncbi:MAG: HD domain-containing protein [Acidimicrobiia bacterium]
MGMETVAGVRIPDTQPAKAASALVAEVSPDFLAEHCRRSHVFAALLGQALGIDYDEELLYLCAILHDLGVTDRFATGERLEVAGAKAAADFARDHGLPEDRVASIWDAVALHTSLGIADAKGGEVALTHFGVVVDVVGLRYDLLPEGAADAVLSAFPRRGFKNAFHGLVLKHAAQNPAAYAFTWLHESVRDHVAPLPTFDEAFFGAPFAE